MGHVNRRSNGTIGSMISIAFDVPDRISIFLRNENGLTLSVPLQNVGGVLPPTTLPSSDWSYEYSPLAGAGYGQVKASLRTSTGRTLTQVINLTKEFLDGFPGVNAFGLYKPASTGANPASAHDQLFDDITYTVEDKSIAQVAAISGLSNLRG